MIIHMGTDCCIRSVDQFVFLKVFFRLLLCIGIGNCFYFFERNAFAAVANHSLFLTDRLVTFNHLQIWHNIVKLTRSLHMRFELM